MIGSLAAAGFARSLLAVGTAALLSVGAMLAAGPARAASPPVFAPGTVSASFPTLVSWRFSFQSEADPLRIELLTRLGGSDLVFASAAGPTEVSRAADGSWVVAGTDPGGVTPNTRYQARLRVTTAEGTFVGPEASVLVEDERFDWHVRESDRLRLHWHEGDDAFARRALRIGEDGVAEAEDFLGVRLPGKVDIFVYAEQEPFRDAIGPGSPENAAGVPFSSIQTFFVLIRPEQIGSSWVGDVVPHELVHLVLDAAIGPGVDLPLWLNEGLAVYLSTGYTDSDRRLVRDAIGDRTLVPLDGLTGNFPYDADGARSIAAYSESASAVDFMVRTYGQEGVAALIEAFATQGPEAAFRSALGIDPAGFEAAWLRSLDAPAPEAFGPRPAPPGPVPEDWQGPPPVGGLLPSPSPLPSAAPTPAPALPEAEATERTLVTLLVGGLVGGLTLIALAAFLADRRRREPPG